MAYFPQTVAFQLAGGTPKLDLLVFFDFLSQPKRIWNGFGNIPTPHFDPLESGTLVWEGIGGLGAIEGLSQPVGSAAPEITFKVSGAEPDGVDANFVKLATGDPRQFYNRSALVLIQFFDDRFQALDRPYAISGVLMSAMEIDRQPGSDQGPVRQVSIRSESILFRRARPSFAYWSDRDQQSRFPGDRAMERMSELQFHTDKWPNL